MALSEMQPMLAAKVESAAVSAPSQLSLHNLPESVHSLLQCSPLQVHRQSPEPENLRMHTVWLIGQSPSE